MLVKFFLFEVNTMPSFLLDAHARCHAGCVGYLFFWVNLHTFVSAFVDRDIRSGVQPGVKEHRVRPVEDGEDSFPAVFVFLCRLCFLL